QKQRTALGRTLVAQPDVFLLDEPISHLDAKIRHELRLQFHTLEELRSVATLYVTHDYAEALSLGDRIGVMGHGGLVQVGSARELFQQPQHLLVAQHLGQPSINVVEASLASSGDDLKFTAEGASLTLPVAGPHRPVLSGRSAGRITVGIRPQHVQVVANGAAANGEAVVDATVSIYEALGAAGILVAESGGVRLTALTPPNAVFQHGEPVRLALRNETFLYFDAESGRNVMVA
ncbi:MAG TPA: ABC transporter ATP-binding protein, partial [Kiloniellaceae bacterium]|nr:ABC transporter ATP-binding protein [Kiloniellaceae bacterium]